MLSVEVSIIVFPEKGSACDTALAVANIRPYTIGCSCSNHGNGDITATDNHRRTVADFTKLV